MTQIQNMHSKPHKKLRNSGVITVLYKIYFNVSVILNRGVK